MKVSSKKHSNLEISSSTAGVTLDESLTAKYNARVVEYALKLKAKNGEAYSDEFYLEYARKLDLNAMSNKFSRSAARKAANCPIQDPLWSGYSYEEILQMENNGCQIPEEVLLWAHAQQESDITAYEIISSESETDDNTSTNEVTGDFDLNNLQKKAKEYTNKSKKAQEEAQKYIEEYNVLKEKALKIKQEKEETYQDSINEISNLTKEWKDLDKKSKNGTLSSSEQRRYGELNKMLGNNSSIIQDIQIDSKDLDELLSSMNLLETNSNKNIELANETIKAASDLSGYQSKYNSEQQTINTSGIVYSDSGLLSDLMFGANGSSIEAVALETAQELVNQSNSTITDLNTSDNTELSEFATNYTNAADKALQETQNAMSNNNAESSKTKMQDENSTQTAAQNTTTNQPVQQTNKNPQNKIYLNISSKKTGNKDTQVDDGGKNPNFFVLPVGGRPELALIATTTSALSTANLKSKQKDVNNTDKALQKDLAKTNKEVKRVTKEADRIEQKHAEFLQRAEIYSAQLDMLMAEEEAKQLAAQQEIETRASQQTANVSAQNNIGNAQQGANATTTNTTQTQNTQQPEVQQQVSPEVEAVMEQLNYLSGADQEMMASLTKPVTKAKASVAANQKAAKSLQAQNNNLDERNSNNKKVQRNTLICGGMTTALGAYNMAVAVPLLKTGIAMASFPPTAAAGTALVALSTRWIIIASLQLSLGPGAIAAGTVGLVASSDVSDDIKDHNNNYGDVIKASNANNKALRLANNVVTQADQIIVPDLSAYATTQPQNNNNNNNNQGNNNLSTSRTTNMTFQDVKDITKMPQGPTNLSNPLNDTTKRNSQNTTTEQNQNINNTNTETPNNNTQNQTATTGVSRTSATNEINRTPRTTTLQNTEENNNRNQQTPQTRNTNSANNIQLANNTNPANNRIRTNYAQTQQNQANQNTRTAMVQPGNINKAQGVEANTSAKTTTTPETTTPQTTRTQQQQTTRETTTPNASTTKTTNETTTTNANVETSTLTANIPENNTTTETTTPTVSTTEPTTEPTEDKIQEQEKQNKTKAIAESSKAEQSNLYNQINAIENENQTTANNSDKVNEIFKNNLTRLASLQQQFENLNTTVQNTNADEVTEEINPVRNELETGSDRINTIITNTNNKIGIIAQPTEDATENNEIDTEIIELERQRDELDKDITDESSDNTNTQAAAATSGANVNATTISDDKAERKLARFNIDSIIESKKKKKKVLAVSAASGGSVKG